MIRYLSGAANAALEAVAAQYGIGLMIQPGNFRAYGPLLDRYPAWCADNGAFTTVKGGFNPWRYITMISCETLLRALASCLFITAPDVLIVLPDGRVVGNAAATLRRFPLWSSVLHALGYPVALVAQDGLETMLDKVPWNDFEVLFVGGSTEWKLSVGARHCVDEARRRGKRTHMGRVNSYKRLALAVSWGIDTADGTYLKYGPEKNLPKLLSWLERLNGEKT